MSKFKGGFVTTVSIFFFLVFGLMLFIGIKGVLAQFIISAQTDFKITLKADDRGTQILSFLNSERSGVKNIEILGYFDTPNSDLSGVEKGLEKIRSVEGKNFTLNVVNKKSFGEGTGEKAYVDIPLPGGKIGGIELIS